MVSDDLGRASQANEFQEVLRAVSNVSTYFKACLNWYFKVFQRDFR